MRLISRGAIASLVLLGLTVLAVGAAHAQVTLLWNNSGTDWATATNWTPNSVPNNATNTQFSPQTGVTGLIQNPVITGSQAALSLLLANNYAGGGWNFTGGGSLTLGGTNSLGLVTRGAASYIFNGPNLIGSGTGSLSAFANIDIGTSTGLTLTGNSTATTNIGNLTFHGGSLTVDNSTTDLGARFVMAPTKDIGFNGGGTLLFQADANGSNFGTVTTANPPGGLNGRVRLGAGDATIKIVQAAGTTGASTVTFARLDRQTAAGTINFVAEGGGTLGGGGATDPTIFFTVAPPLTNGVISTAAGGATLGFALVNGTDWATYGANGVAAVASTNISGALANPGIPTTTNGNLTGNATIAAGTTFAINTLKISPSSLTGQSLTLGAGATLSTVGILYNSGGAGGDFTISGGSLGGNATRTIYVTNADSALFTDTNFAGTNQPLVKSGDGFLILTGTTDQFGFPAVSPQNIFLAGGTLRARISGPTANIGANNDVRFVGGVLEVDSTGIGGGSTFNRALGTGAGQVTWTGGASTSANNGSGGFSAVGGNLTVNLGGAGAAVTWGGTTAPNNTFVQDGYSLIFGSRRADSVVIWQNPLNLDSGASGAYLAREIHVIDNTGSTGDRVRFDAAISGTNTTDLIKTGDGTLELNAANTYTGNTLVKEGVLQVSSGSNIGTGTLAAPTSGGTVYVYSGGTLSGEGEIRSSAAQGAAYVMGGAVAPGIGVSGDIGTLSLTSMTLTNGATMRYDLDNTANQGGSAASDRVSLSTFFNKGARVDPLLFDFLFTGASGNVYTLATFTTTNYSVSDFSATNLPGGITGIFVLNANDLEFVTSSFTVPEPGSVALLGVGLLGMGRFIRRSRRR